MMPRTRNLDEPTTEQMNASYDADAARAEAYHAQVALWNFRRENRRMTIVPNSTYAMSADCLLVGMQYTGITSDKIQTIVDLYRRAHLYHTAWLVEMELAQ